MGKLFAKWFGGSAKKGGDSEVLADNALKYADTYALEAGSRRRASRAGGQNARATWFARDAPRTMGGAERRFTRP